MAARRVGESETEILVSPVQLGIRRGSGLIQVIVQTGVKPKLSFLFCTTSPS